VRIDTDVKESMLEVSGEWLDKEGIEEMATLL